MSATGSGTAELQKPASMHNPRQTTDSVVLPCPLSNDNMSHQSIGHANKEEPHVKSKIYIIRRKKDTEDVK